MKTFFFGDHLSSAGKTAWISDFGRKIPRKIGKKLFFFGDHLFSAGKFAWISDFGRKISLYLWFSPCLFDPDWDKFLMPPCPSRIHINKLLVLPQKFISAPLSSRYPGTWPDKKYDFHYNYNSYNASQQAAGDEVSNIILSQFSISVLVVLILSKNNFMIVPFFGFSRYCKIVKIWELKWFIAKCYEVLWPNA